MSVLFDGLPGESLTKTAVRDALSDERLAELAKQERKGHGQWSHLEMLQAAQIDVMRSLLHAFVQVHGGESKQPDPWPRPGVAVKNRNRAARTAFVLAMAQEHADLHGYQIGA